MKIFNAIPGFGPDFTEKQVNQFLESKLNLQLGTIDDRGDPCINPVWFLHQNSKLYVATPEQSRKAQNALRGDAIYFSIDDENFPYKGVKGKATVNLLEGLDNKLAIAEKIITKYMGSLDNDIGRFIIGQIKEGNEAVLEISPKYYSAWSFEPPETKPL
jgi:nitroimidazol reductase NimA-like FMN-containing flavoprotein (pyridoxamine 5'-phosphate oxidase superfamily)